MATDTPNDLDKAVEDIAFLVNRLSGLLSIKDTLSSFANIQRQVSSLEVSKADLTQAIQDAQAKVEVLNAVASDLEDKAAAKAKEAEEKAKTIVDAARDQALATSDAIQRAAQGAVDEAVDRKNAVLAEIDKHTTTLDDVKAQLSEQTGKLDKVKAEFEVFKSKF